MVGTCFAQIIIKLAGLASDSPVALEPLSGARRAVTFYLDQARGFVEWQPLAMGAGPARLLLAPGYVVKIWT